MRQVLRQTSDMRYFGRSSGAVPSQIGLAAGARWPVESWNSAPLDESAASDPAVVATWWETTDEGYTLLQRLALAHTLVGICVALALAWQLWSASSLAYTPAIGLILAIGGALALLFSHMDHPACLWWARVALVLVDLGAAGGILWLRGAEGWTLLVLLPPIALAIAFFAERGGAAATVLAVGLIVVLDLAAHSPAAEWMPSLLVFVGVAASLVAFLGVYAAHVLETSERLRWQLAKAQETAERLRTEQQKLVARMRSLEQAQEPLLHERARFAEVAADLTILTRRMSQGDLSATQTLQTLRPGAYGPLADLASVLTRIARTSSSAWSASAITALDSPLHAQGQALQSLDMMARTLCVSANELVSEARSLEPGVRLLGSDQFSRAHRQLEQHLTTQAAHLALFGTQLADIRTAQENLETSLARAAAGAKTPPVFGNSDIRAISQFSASQAGFGASAIRRPVVTQAVTQAVIQSDNGIVRWGHW